MKNRDRLIIFLTASVFWNPLAADESNHGNDTFFSAIEWKFRAGLTDFQVDNTHTPGIEFGFRGNYTSASGIDLELKTSAIYDYDTHNLDPDHIPIWFKSRFRAEKEIVSLTPSSRLLATFDLDHKMNTVSSIEQSATLMPGLKVGLFTPHLELFARFGAGGYYLEIDDDLPEIYSDYSREDLGNSEFAWFQEYKAKLILHEHFSASCRYQDFRAMGSERLESRKKIEIAYTLASGNRLVFDAEKTHYNLDQFSRSAGDNGLAVLPFDEDTFYQAYVEYAF